MAKNYAPFRFGDIEVGLRSIPVRMELREGADKKWRLMLLAGPGAMAMEEIPVALSDAGPYTALEDFAARLQKALLTPEELEAL